MAALQAGLQKHLRTDGAAESLIGSSTACVVVFDKLNSKLHTSNLGDSVSWSSVKGESFTEARSSAIISIRPFNSRYPLKKAGHNSEGEIPVQKSVVRMRFEHNSEGEISVQFPFTSLPDEILPLLNRRNIESFLEIQKSVVLLQVRAVEDDREGICVFRSPRRTAERREGGSAEKEAKKEVVIVDENYKKTERPQELPVESFLLTKSIK